MKRLFIWLLWALVIAGACVAGDHLLLHSSMNSPTYNAAQTFYKDFRGRLIQVSKKEDYRLDDIKKSLPTKMPALPSLPDSIPTLKMPTLPPIVQDKIKPLLQPEKEESNGYVYVDKDGELHMTTSRDEIPKEYRSAAKPLQK